MDLEMDLKRMKQDELVSGQKYLIEREPERWVVSQYFKTELGIDLWHDTDSYTMDNFNGKIYELPTQ